MSPSRKPPEFIGISVPRGDVRIITDRCKGCGFCVEFCPKQVLVLSRGFNRKGYHPPEVVKHGECINCNLCEMICPDFAIFSVPTVAGATTATPGSSAVPSTGESR